MHPLCSFTQITLYQDKTHTRILSAPDTPCAGEAFFYEHHCTFFFFFNGFPWWAKTNGMKCCNQHLMWLLWLFVVQYEVSEILQCIILFIYWLIYVLSTQWCCHQDASYLLSKRFMSHQYVVISSQCSLANGLCPHTGMSLHCISTLMTLCVHILDACMLPLYI